MALDIGDLTDRWGKILGGINEANSFRGSDTDTRADTINALYPTAADQREVVDGLYTQRESLRGAMDTWSAYLATLMGTTISTMSRDDTARPKTDDVFGWFDKLNRDMVGGGSTFDRPTVTGTVAAGTNIGDGYLLASVLEPIDGIVTYFAFQEVIRFLCTSDSYENDVSAGNEIWSADGTTAVDATAYNWPKGSGSSVALTAITADSAAILVDPSWESWSGTGNNTMDEWSTNGTSGTHVFRGSSSPYSGDYFLTCTGDGALTLTIWQIIDQTLVDTNTPFGVQFWYKVPAATLATAALRVALTNGSGTVLTDNAGTALSSTLATGTLNAATSWTRAGVVFTAPRNWPTELRLEFKFTGMLDSAKSVYIDYCTLAPLERLYDGGPFAALFAGETAFAIDDSFTYTVVNDPDGALDPTETFVRSLDRFFDLAGNGIRLTTSTTGSIADTKIS